ncbi:MAG: helix-turn-helix domain-containing protein [Methanothrix sp.]|nr:helix-turn-helix domain-containing protein [Methanothrix sp.]
MKSAEREQARQLRAQGWSIKHIARELGVSPSSVSVWVRDVQFTEAQRQELLGRNPRMDFYDRVIAEGRERRRGYQDSGREKARAKDPLHLAGCMLYWAEGAKSRNYLRLTNSDPHMIVFFLGFLRQCYNVPTDKTTITINCFTDSGISLEEIEQYWLEMLGLPRSCLRKSTVNQYSKYSTKKRAGKLKYGVCALKVHSTAIVQEVYGAIQEYAGFRNEGWLD